MAISSNSLFHYTRNLNSLKGILKKGFQISYCMESENAYPMISFCDIPLGGAKNHLENYGKYAIGMTKEWGINNGLNPVLYIEDNSLLKGTLSEARSAISLMNKKEIEYDKNWTNVKFFIMETMRYSKPYIGKLVRGESSIEKYKFYDEREWRYIPPLTNLYFEPGLNRKEYSKFKESHPSKPHFEENGLIFKAEDIKYIVISSKSEIPEIIEFLMQLTNLGSAKSIQLLFTRILTADQIIEDF